MKKLTLLCAAVLFVIPLVSSAETINDQPEVVSQYTRAKRLMREGNFLEASRIFERLAGEYPDSPNQDLFLYHRAKADYHFGDYDAARAGFTQFLSRFPGSPFAPDVRYFLGNIDYIKGDITRAFQRWVEVFGTADDPLVRSLAKESAVSAVRNASSVKLTPQDFEQIPAARRCELIEPIARIMAERGDDAMAARLRSQCSTQAGSRESQNFTRSFDVGLVLPFSGELESYGEEIYNGAVIAAALYRQETGNDITITPYDSKGLPVDAARQVRELTRSRTDLVVGPLTSEAAAVASASLACDSLPMIVPAATEAGLTELSATSFQLSPNVEFQGTLMAEYARQVLKADSAAIITSTGSDHMRMTRAFSERFMDLGGHILAVEYYRPRDRDFGPIVRDLKQMLIGEAVDSVFYIDEYGDTLDYDVVPVRIDALYLPGSADQLRLLLPQVHFYNLSADLLGSDGWGDQEVFKLQNAVTRGAVFPSPFLQTDYSEELTRFATAFDARFGKQPGRLSKLGYDAIRIATRAVAEGAVDRDKLLKQLAAVRNYQGAAGIVTFGDHRENIALPLFRIENERPVYLGTGRAVLAGQPVEP